MRLRSTAASSSSSKASSTDATVPRLAKQLGHVVERGGLTVLDLRELKFIDSTGLVAIVNRGEAGRALPRAARGRFDGIADRPPVRDHRAEQGARHRGHAGGGDGVDQAGGAGAPGARGASAGSARLARPRLLAPPAAAARRSGRRGRCSPSSTEPPWDSATARTIARPRPLPPPRVAVARTKRSNTCVAHLGGDARAVVGHLEHGAAVLAVDGHVHARARRGVDERVLDQVERQPVQVVGRAVHEHGGRAVLGQHDRRARGRRPAAPPRRRPRARSRRGRPARGASGRRPASARASSSRSATSRRIRRDERSAEPAISRLVALELLLEQLEVGQDARERRAQLVRRVGHELALARRARPPSRCALRRAPPSISSSVRARSAISSSASGFGSSTSGSRVRAIAWAAPVRLAIGAIARRATARPASRASSGAAEHAHDQEERAAVQRCA